MFEGGMGLVLSSVFLYGLCFQSRFIQNDVEIPPFLHLEEEFIPKILFAMCPFEGRANHGRPSIRTRCKKVFAGGILT